MFDFLRKNEYKILFYRLLLAYFFYFIARVLFYFYNSDLLGINTVSDFFRLSYYGLAFDTAAILYVNALFVVLSLIPLKINTRKWYQQVLFYVYFIFNLVAYAINFVDFIYYRFTFSRTTKTVFETLENESNKANMFFRFLVNYWHVYLLFFAMAALWIFLYKKVKIKEKPYQKSNLSYFVSSILVFCFLVVMMIGGIRGGDFKKSTRPINMVDASRHVTKLQQADFVLNSPFAYIRTFTSDNIKKVKYSVAPNAVEKYFKPVKQYKNNPKTTPNIVVFIVESYGREYWGTFNKNTEIPNFKSYTPFLDSLAEHSLIFPNAFANGRKSIHGMSSVIAGIPSFEHAFTSSSYANQKIQSLVSTLKESGYDTSFFHGAPNGSMGFLGFSNILGFDHYYGMTEYGKDEDHDGFWGIWDEEFMQYTKQVLDTEKEPFFASLFTLTSHEPYIVPEKYKGVFPDGDIPMHEVVGYTDHAFKRFFEAAKKESWFNNTIFILTADHTNQSFYKDEYYKVINRGAVPILIYKPDSTYVGVDDKLAQQIDIYPTVLDAIGYDKPFRSWGRSLIGKPQIEPYVMNYNGTQYQLLRGNYICIFDGKKATGFYDINDKGLTNNLIGNRTPEMDEIEEACKAFLKDYFDRIVDKKLSHP
ncbi:sulfatase-like hydrolase/transferase [Aureibaculum sp. 2210JD6-5]|uniref:LTA synthase family protein n=1 Tax=Aureibaculum sp. 2210JD6-5 TaxID=3103957 RepID=UPI002AAC615A|nr:sulfatase-like hydrolase/transferase [Aureibaculum sp. 2210JD6-5]MDY7395259.1 sulfatase-like hydrolase/transferase [Aureibaculum sp. 2210JD6-5]